jgi:hypothetical protein
MAHIIDFQKYKEKKKQKHTINVDIWNEILDYEYMAEQMQSMIDQILEQTPLIDSDGNFHYTIEIDK